MEGLDVRKISQLKQILSLIEDSFPVDQLYVDYASSPKEFKTKHSDEELEELALSYLENFAGIGFEINDIALLLEKNAPFSDYRRDWESYLKTSKE